MEAGVWSDEDEIGEITLRISLEMGRSKELKYSTKRSCK